MLSLRDLYKQKTVWFPKIPSGSFTGAEILKNSYDDWIFLNIRKYNEKMLIFECIFKKTITLKSDNQKLLEQIFEILSNKIYQNQSMEKVLSEKLFTII